MLILALGLLASTLAVPARAGAGSCRRPEPTVDYDDKRIVVSLDVRLGGCSWWRSDMISIEGDMEQSMAGLPIGQGIAAFKGCGIAMLYEGPRKKAPPLPVSKRCVLRLKLEHDPVERAEYTGSFSYPWKDGNEKVDFSYTCTSVVITSGC